MFKSKGRYNSNGRVSICDIESYRFESYYLPIPKIQKTKYRFIKTLKISLSNIRAIDFQKHNSILYNKYKYVVKKNNDLSTIKYIKNSYLLFYNNKTTVFDNIKISRTWSIGILLKVLNILNSKFIRRTTKGYKILINFLNIQKHTFFKTNNRLIFYFKCINNRFFFLKKKIFKIFFKKNIFFF